MSSDGKLMRLWIHKAGGEKFGSSQVSFRYQLSLWLCQEAKRWSHCKLGGARTKLAKSRARGASAGSRAGVGGGVGGGGRLLEVWRPGEDWQRLPVLWDPATSPDGAPPPGIVSVEASVAGLLGLKHLEDVCVRGVAEEALVAESVELSVKEQYVSRGDMWRIAGELRGSLLHVGTSVLGSRVRMGVRDVWRGGERLVAGLVGPTTRLVFRSASATQLLFVQLSQEMWEMDSQGDLYWEKCVDGLLPKVFQGWLDQKCSHYVSVVVFSRWYYDEERLPAEAAAEDLQRDYAGRRYRDFYRLLVQNEHYEDWRPVLRKLKRAFRDYHASIRKHHRKVLGEEALREAEADGRPALFWNSSAADGNFLETINMSLNVFSRHYVDRTLDRTGQQILVVTPGCGVFNVDRALSNLTKQRSFDMGVSIDMLCLGEQPLHAVPLFVFHNRSRLLRGDRTPGIEDYFIPHWMNYNFYNPNTYHRPAHWFRPRIKIPASICDAPEGIVMEGGPITDDPSDPLAYPDFEAHDAARQSAASGALRREVVGASGGLHRQSSVPDIQGAVEGSSVSSAGGATPHGSSRSVGRRQRTDSEELRVGSADLGPNTLGPSSASSQPHDHPARRKVSSGRQVAPTKKPLVNPFMPSEFSVRITSNRRRWIHVFPVDSQGRAKQAHHYVSGVSLIYAMEDADRTTSVSESLGQGPERSWSRSSSAGLGYASPPKSALLSSTEDEIPLGPGAGPVRGSAGARGKTLVWCWGPTGEEQWKAELEIGVDWKSLILPALLPITTDFFPDSKALVNDYAFSEHTLVVDDEAVRELWAGTGEGRPERTREEIRAAVYDELVAQRLAKGFQLIHLPKRLLHASIAAVAPHSMALQGKVVREDFLSVNRIFHRIYLVGGEIRLTEFLYRHTYHVPPKRYPYQFQVPDAKCYESSTTTFRPEAMDKVNWSVIDNYVLSQGREESYRLDSGMKFWDARFVLLPRGHPATKAAIAAAAQSPKTKGSGASLASPPGSPRKSSSFRCDVYASTEAPELAGPVLEDGLVRFLEGLNRVRRPPNARRHIARGPDSPPPQPPDPAATDVSAAEALSLVLSQLSFLEGRGLPAETFVSAELVHCLLRLPALPSVPDLPAATAFAQKLLDQGLIVRAVEEKPRRERFRYGFFLYAKASERKPSETSDELDASRWVEVEMSEREPAEEEERWGRVSLDLVALTKRSRASWDEWAELRYSRWFRPSVGLVELELVWLAGMGSSVAEVVYSLWMRRAPACHYHLVPTPLDPFALPSNADSDPLRCPVSMPLQAGIRAAAADEGLLEALEAETLKRFGFIALRRPTKDAAPLEFVHLSGGMFVLLSGGSGRFLWSWNKLLSHRFRSSASGDEEFQDFIFADFKAFTSGADQRLHQVFGELKSSDST